MRAWLFARRSAAVAASAIVSALVVACAAADTPADAVSGYSDAAADNAVLPPDDRDASAPDDTTVADAAMPCSRDGWCKTMLPGLNIIVHDVVPFENRAFALMEGDNILFKVGEWTPEAGWTLLKGTPNVGRYDFWQNLWAPDEDTVYTTDIDISGLFTGGASGVVVVRGRRPVAPATEWTWTQSRIPCDTLPASAAIGGNKDGDVYVATCGKIYRLDTSPGAGAASDGGADAGAETLQFVEEAFVDVDQGNPINFYDIGGTGPDDLWFAGARALNASLFGGQSPCAILVHKTADGYRTVLDGIPDSSGCTKRGDFPMVAGSLSQGISTPSKNRVLAATQALDEHGVNVLLNVGLSGDQVTVATTRPPESTTPGVVGSVWGTSTDDVLFIATTFDTNLGRNNSVLIRGQSIWGDSPSYGFSHLAINGSPNSNELMRVRGTSNQNLWAVGRYNAYHKSTP